MKSFKEFLSEAKSGNYYEIGGDPYDGGVVVNVYVKGQEVHSEIQDGEWPFRYKNKDYPHINKLLAAIGKDYGLKASEFKRVEF